MSAISVRPIIKDKTDSPYMDVMYTLEEEEWVNVTDYQEGSLGNGAGNLSRSSNCSELASLNATVGVDDIEVLAVEYDDER